MFRIVPFEPQHISGLPNASGQEALVRATDMAAVTAGGVHRSVLADSLPIACVGVSRIHDYRGFAWAIISSGYPHGFKVVHRAAKRVLALAPFSRIETYVDPRIPENMQWVRLLGFRLEAPYKPYIFPDGRGAAEWVIYKDVLDSGEPSDCRPSDGLPV